MSPQLWKAEGQYRWEAEAYPSILSVNRNSFRFSNWGSLPWSLRRQFKITDVNCSTDAALHQSHCIFFGDNEKLTVLTPLFAFHVQLCGSYPVVLLD